MTCLSWPVEPALRLREAREARLLFDRSVFSAFSNSSPRCFSFFSAPSSALIFSARLLRSAVSSLIFESPDPLAISRCIDAFVCSSEYTFCFASASSRSARASFSSTVSSTSGSGTGSGAAGAAEATSSRIDSTSSATSACDAGREPDTIDATSTGTAAGVPGAAVPCPCVVCALACDRTLPFREPSPDADGATATSAAAAAAEAAADRRLAMELFLARPAVVPALEPTLLRREPCVTSGVPARTGVPAPLRAAEFWAAAEMSEPWRLRVSPTCEGEPPRSEPPPVDIVEARLGGREGEGRVCVAVPCQ
eukprot:Rhum_TRINITY_DN14338_c3_g1::Rhum_TRINITY_DN14338_c3_g1_i1::g.81619::m.81619